jgi:ribosomal protein L18E
MNTSLVKRSPADSTKRSGCECMEIAELARRRMTGQTEEAICDFVGGLA